jgi:hypothetical protein
MHSGGTPAKPGFLRSKKCAQKTKMQSKYRWRARMQSAVFVQKAEAEATLPGR